MLTRRRLLRFGGGLAAEMAFPLQPVRAHNGGGPPANSPPLRQYVDPLPRLAPSLKPTGTLDGSPLYEIAARAMRQKLHRDLPPTPLWGYAGQFPGPTLEVRRGQKIFVRWQNELTEPGFLIPPAFDVT